MKGILSTMHRAINHTPSGVYCGVCGDLLICTGLTMSFMGPDDIYYEHVNVKPDPLRCYVQDAEEVAKAILDRPYRISGSVQHD